jgi:predicted small metal-binding protein
MTSYSAQCVKCSFVASAMTQERTIDALIDHAVYAHPKADIRPLHDEPERTQ